MAKLKTVLDLIAEVLVNLREDLGVNTFPFIFLWVDDNQAIDVYVERDDGTYRYHITSPVTEFVKYLNCREQGPIVEEFTLTGFRYVNPRTRKIQTYYPGQNTGGGSLLCDGLPGEFSAKDAITHALRRYVEDKDIRTLI